MDEGGLREKLKSIDPSFRQALRNLLIRPSRDRDDVAQLLLHSTDSRFGEVAEFLDFMTLDDDARRRVVQILGSLEATDEPDEVRASWAL
jgi:hypothetical protein